MSRNNDHNREIPRTPWRDPEGGEIHYHYNRAEREATRERIWTPPTGGFLRRNRGLTIVLVDVIIVVLIFFIYLFFLRPLAGQMRIGEYRATARTFAVEDEVLVMVMVTIRYPVDPSQVSRSQPVVTVTVGEHSVSDLAPRAGQERTILLRLPVDEVTAETERQLLVSIGDYSAETRLEEPERFSDSAID